MADTVTSSTSDRTKFAFALIVIAAATMLRALNLITGGEWVSVATWISALFMVGQVAAVLAQGWTVQTMAKATAKSREVA